MTSNGSNAVILLMFQVLIQIMKLQGEGKYQQALNMAANILREQGDKIQSLSPGDVLLTGLASIAGNAFSMALVLGDNQSALKYAELELSFARQSEENFLIARALNNRGLAQHELNELAAAEVDYQGALAIIDQSAETKLKSLRGAVASNLGQLQISRGELDNGMKNLKLSTRLPMPQIAMVGASDEILQLNNEGFLGLNEGDINAAEAAWMRALDLARSQANNPAVRGILVCNLAELYHRTNRRPQAIEYYKEAIRIHASDSGSKQALAIDYTNLAIVHQQSGDGEKALECFKRAWDSVREVAPRSLVALQALKGIGLHRMVQKDMKRARASFERGIELYEQMRPEIAVHEIGHRGFLEAYRQLLEMAMYLSMHESWPDELLTHIERAKARFSLERVVLRGSVDARKESRISQDPILTGYDALILNYFVGPNATFLSYRYNRRIGATRIDMGENELSSLIQSFRADLMSSSRRAGHGEVGKKLSQMLFKKVSLESGRVRHIHLMPDGPLWYLPFEALPAPEWMSSQNGTKPLGAVGPISYTSSMSLLAALRNRNEELSDRADWRFLAVGQPKNTGDFNPLPGTGFELDDLEKMASGRVEITVLRDEMATKDRFLSLLPGFTHIHIASHAVADFEMENPLILFSGDGPEKFLRTEELLNTKMNAQLVFLSACSTSVGQSSTGEGLMSMARAFLWAGCRCVVATLWPVDDGGAPEFVRLFYSGLLAKLSVAQAICAAREKFRTANGQPRTWAAFQVIGDADTWKDRFSLKHID